MKGANTVYLMDSGCLRIDDLFKLLAEFEEYKAKDERLISMLKAAEELLYRADETGADYTYPAYILLSTARSIINSA